MKAEKMFISLEKLYKKRSVLEKQIIDMEKKIVMDLEKRLLAGLKPTAKPKAKKPSSRKKPVRKRAKN